MVFTRTSRIPDQEFVLVQPYRKKIQGRKVIIIEHLRLKPLSKYRYIPRKKKRGRK